MVIKVYISGMSGNKEVKKRQQRVTMIMDSKHIEYTVIDITEPGQEAEKDFMQANAQHKGCTISDPNPRHALPPQLFNDTEYCGDYDDFDMANEVDNLEVFLKLAAPEAEHKNGAATEEATATAAAATEATDDEDKENKTEDNNADGAADTATEAAAEDGTNEKSAPEGASQEANDDEKDAPAPEGTTSITAAAADGQDADEAKEAENSYEPLSTKHDGDNGESDDGNERLLGDNLDENDKAANEQVVEADVVSEEESEPTVERSVVEATEATFKAVEVEPSVTSKEEDDDGDRESTQSKDAVLVKESESVEETEAESTTNSDEKLIEEDTLPHTNNLEQHESTAVSTEKDTDDNVTNGKETAGSHDEAMEEASDEDGNESVTSDDEEDSQKANNISRLEQETDVVREQHQTAVDDEKEEKVLQQTADSMEVESLATFDEEKADTDEENSTSLKTSPADFTKESAKNVQLNEDPVKIEEGDEDGSRNDNSTITNEQRSSADESLPVSDTGSSNENSSTPPPPSATAAEESSTVVEMDADLDEEEQELLKTSAALAGKSEDAEELDIEQETTVDETEQSADQDDAGEDGISSKLVDTDDPMLAEEEQEE